MISHIGNLFFEVKLASDGCWQTTAANHTQVEWLSVHTVYQPDNPHQRILKLCLGPLLVQLGWAGKAFDKTNG